MRLNKKQQILDLRRSGQSLKKIAEIVGCSHVYCGQICRAAGMGGAIIEQRLTESQVADYISRSGFTYVGGYQSQRKPIVVRCNECGGTFDRQFHIFRDVATGTWRDSNECPNCRRRKQEQKIIEVEHEAQQKAKLKEQMKAERLSRDVNDELTRRLAIHVCKNCGKEFCQMVTGYNSKTYCSEKCQKRYFNRSRSEKRHKKLMQREHDNDISLEKLFKRDNGVCYLCGGSCDWTDGEWRDGTFIAGPSYPSIDHVKPIAKGGTHTWENVRLACRECNWIKRDST